MEETKEALKEYSLEQKYVTKKEKIRFLTGLAGQNIVYSLIGGSFFSYFLTEISLIPAQICSVLLLLGKIWDGINDPVVGSIVDRCTFKSGEKLRPLLKWTPVFVGIFLVLMFFVLPVPEELLWLRVMYFVIMYLCWDIVYTLQDVAIWGITAMSTPVPDEREDLTKWARTVGSCVFGVMSVGIPWILEMFVNLTGLTWQISTFIFAIVFGLNGALLSRRAYVAKERVPLTEKQESLRKSFSLLFKNRMLLLISLGNVLSAVGFGSTLITYFFKYMVPSDFIGTSFIGALGLTTLYSVITGLPTFISMLFADKLKKLCGNSYVNVLIMIQSCNIIFRIAAFFVGFEGTKLWIAIAFLTVAGLPSGATSIAQTSLFADSIDYMEWKTGMRTEGVTFSMQTFFTKASSGINQGLAMLALSLLGYVAIDRAESFVGLQSQAFNTWIWPLMILTPAIGSLLYIIPLLFINYTKKQKEIVTEDLRRRRENLPESGESPYYKEHLAQKFAQDIEQ